MNPRPALAIDQVAAPRPSARIARVAELLDCDESQVRRLIDKGALDAHGLGKRGLRVFLDSVADYQAGRRRQAATAPRTAPKPRQVDLAAQRAAEGELRKSGILR
jgi:hypothetical protein